MRHKEPEKNCSKLITEPGQTHSSSAIIVLRQTSRPILQISTETRKTKHEAVHRCLTSHRRKLFWSTPLKRPPYQLIPHIPLPLATCYARKPTGHRSRRSASYESSLRNVEKFNCTKALYVMVPIFLYYTKSSTNWKIGLVHSRTSGSLSYIYINSYISLKYF